MAAQCLRGDLVDDIPGYLLMVLHGDAICFSPAGLGRTDLEPLGGTRSGAVTTLRFRVSNYSSVTPASTPTTFSVVVNRCLVYAVSRTRATLYPIAQNYLDKSLVVRPESYEPYDPGRPVECLNEKSVTIHADVFPPCVSRTHLSNCTWWRWSSLSSVLMSCSFDTMSDSG